MSLPEPYPSERWIPVPLHPDDPAVVGVAAALRRLLHVVRDNEQAMIEDVHPNHLHDYRVAIRRARAIMGRTRGVFKKRRTRAVAAELRWLSAVTGGVRDADVLGITLEAWGEGPTVRAAQQARRARARDLLLQALGSSRYHAALEQFDELLASRPGRKGQRAISRVAHASTRTAWRRVLRDGRVIDPLSTAFVLHELRKRCKKLRYLVEGFGSLYEGEDTPALIAPLRLVQDALGMHQDCVVQRTLLEELLVERPAATDVQALLSTVIARQQQSRRDLADRFAVLDTAPIHTVAKRLFAATPPG